MTGDYDGAKDFQILPGFFDEFTRSAGNDTLYGNALRGNGDDRINCFTGTDTVAGNAGTNVIKDDPSEIDESFTDWVDTV